MIHRECGVLKTSYEADMGLYPLPIARWTVTAIAVLFFIVIPLALHEYYLSVANLVWIAVIGALGLNILVGYTGQVSIGHGAFMSVGAYTAANLANRLGSPWPVNLLAGGLMAALIGAIVGIVENVAAGYVDPYVGGGTKDFAPYVLMILALMIRPYGIFGKKIIERV